MQPFFATYFMRLENLHQQVAEALEGLPQEALDWKLTSKANSLAVLAAHIAGGEQFWFVDFLTQRPSGRDRPGEFSTNNVSAPALLDKLAASLDLARANLENLAMQDLSRELVSPRDGRVMSVADGLLHIYEHTALHLAHMQVTRQAWEANRSA